MQKNPNYIASQAIKNADKGILTCELFLSQASRQREEIDKLQLALNYSFRR